MNVLEDAKKHVQIISEMRGDLNEVLLQAREGLVPIPVQGDEWSSELRYITGDVALLNGVSYTALKYSKGKQPDESPEYWEETQAPTVPEWSSIEDGTIIEVGTRVLHEGVVWECIDQHFKSTVYRPKDGSSKWKVVD